MAQLFDHSLVFLFSLFALYSATGFHSHVISELVEVPALLLTFLMLMCVVGAAYRCVAWVLFSTTVGAHFMKLHVRLGDSWGELCSKIILESLQSSFPLVWLVEIVARRLSRNYGIDYVYRFR